MEILLAYKAHRGGARDPHTSLLPVGLGSINAILCQQGYRSRVANFSRFSWGEIAKIIAGAPPAILGISQFTHNRFDSLRLARLAKEINPSCFVVLGGPHATHRYREILSQNGSVDAVVVGEGEETFCELVRWCAQNKMNGLESVRGIAYRERGSVVMTHDRPPLKNLDTLPIAAAYFGDAIGVDVHRQIEFVVTSRGCPASCRFCSSPKFWGRSLRFRSPESIVDEIKYIRDRYGLIHFSIRDDTFTADRKRVLDFCRILLQERVYILWSCQSRVNAVDQEILFWMKRAGCECVQFGIESGSMRVLRVLGKNITREQVREAAEFTRRAGMHLSLYLVTGAPGETDEDVGETLSLLESIKASDGQVSPLVYYPGTSLCEEAMNSGLIGRDLFESETRDALYVRPDDFARNSAKSLLGKIERVAAKTSFTRADFLAQRNDLGYCHATNVMAGEMYESEGKWRKAESEYREIIVREPDNPWGWLMIGELHARRGDAVKARQAFETLASLVPAHAAAYSLLGELCRLEGDYSAARTLYRRALTLDPYESAAHEGMESIGL